MKNIDFDRYRQLLETAKVFDPRVCLHLDDVTDDEQRFYFESEEGISYLNADGFLGGLARFKAGNEDVGRTHQEHRILLGGTFLNCYDGKLVALYKRRGFYVVARIPFDKAFAPEGWELDSDLVKRPDVVFMGLDRRRSEGFDNYFYAYNKVKPDLEFLCRMPQKNGDRANIVVTTLKQALDITGTTLDDVKSFTPFTSFNMIDIHFKNKQDFIRVIRYTK